MVHLFFGLARLARELETATGCTAVYCSCVTSWLLYLDPKDCFVLEFVVLCVFGFCSSYADSPVVQWSRLLGPHCLWYSGQCYQCICMFFSVTVLLRFGKESIQIDGGKGNEAYGGWLV